MCMALPARSFHQQQSYFSPLILVSENISCPLPGIFILRHSSNSSSGQHFEHEAGSQGSSRSPAEAAVLRFSHTAKPYANHGPIAKLSCSPRSIGKEEKKPANFPTSELDASVFPGASQLTTVLYLNLLYQSLSPGLCRLSFGGRKEHIYCLLPLWDPL